MRRGACKPGPVIKAKALSSRWIHVSGTAGTVCVVQCILPCCDHFPVPLSLFVKKLGVELKEGIR